MAPPARARLLLCAAVLALVGTGCSYHAGDEAARDWEDWVKDHPLAGARVTDAVGTNVQPFQGSFEAYARLTATPGESAIRKAMASMCAFNEETDSATTYWLQIDRVSLQAPCNKNGRTRIARFWSEVHDLDGIVELAFSSQGLAVTADDAALPPLVPELSDAADATGLAPRTSTNTYASEHVTITQPHARPLTAELAQIEALLASAGSAVKKVEVVPGGVSAATSGTVAQAHGWQDGIGHGSSILAVTPDRVSTEVPLTVPGRALLDRLATDPQVLGVSVLKPFWTIDVQDSADARGLIRALNDEPGTASLGRLQLTVGTDPYDSATGEGRACFIRPVFPERGRADALLELCDRKAAVSVDDRFDALSVRLHALDLRGTLACLRRLPPGQEVYLMLPQNDNLTFTTGPTLVAEFPNSALAQQLSRIWDSLGRSPG